MLGILCYSLDADVLAGRFCFHLESNYNRIRPPRPSHGPNSFAASEPCGGHFLCFHRTTCYNPSQPVELLPLIPLALPVARSTSGFFIAPCRCYNPPQLPEPGVNPSQAADKAHPAKKSVMSTTGQQKFPCDKCGHAQADIISATNCHITEIDSLTQFKSSRLTGTVYQLKCPQCRHEFSVTVPVA
jgi:Zn finger protein HypA/HybF involved in hydrogenase expression